MSTTKTLCTLFNTSPSCAEAAKEIAKPFVPNRPARPTYVFLHQLKKQWSKSLTHPVQVGIRILWHIIVEHNVDSLNIYSSSKDVSCYHYTSTEILEFLVTVNPVKMERRSKEKGFATR